MGLWISRFGIRGVERDAVKFGFKAWGWGSHTQVDPKSPGPFHHAGQVLQRKVRGVSCSPPAIQRLHMYVQRAGSHVSDSTMSYILRHLSISTKHFWNIGHTSPQYSPAPSNAASTHNPNETWLGSEKQWPRRKAKLKLVPKESRRRSELLRPKQPRQRRQLQRQRQRHVVRGKIPHTIPKGRSSSSSSCTALFQIAGIA